MAEVAPAGNGGGVNRTFLLIVGGLASLLVIGLLAVGALFVLPSFLPKSPSLAAAVTPTRVAIAPTATTTKVPIVATATLVVAMQASSNSTPAVTAPTQSASDSGANGTPAATSAAPPDTGTKGGQAEGTPEGESLPQGGLGENLVLLAVGLVLIVVLFAARRARATG